MRENKFHIRFYAISAVLLLAIHYAVNLIDISELNRFKPFARELSMSLFLIAAILLIGELLEKFINSQMQSEGDRYNLKRIVRLLSITLILVVAITFIFQKPYASLVSIGLVSLVLGFALQAPITSFIAWLYIVFRKPYQVGHRIQINEHRGDVIEISYLDTIIWECSGDYLQNDRRSGRVIHFPNSLILKDKIINYSGPLGSFIWNETAIQIAYTSDLQFVENCLMEAATEDFKEKYPQAYSPKWEPAVYFRINAYAWMEAVVSYPVEPEDTTGRRNRILRKALPKLNSQPEKVQFPEGAKR